MIPQNVESVYVIYFSSVSFVLNRAVTLAWHGDTRHKISILEKQIPTEIPLTTDDFSDMIVDL